MKPLIALIVFFFIGHSFAQQELRSNQQYAAGASVKNQYFGVSLRIPANSVGTFSDQNGVQALAVGTRDGNGNEAGVVMLMQHGVGLATYKTLLGQPFPVGQVTLEPTSAVRAQGQSLSVTGADIHQGIAGQIHVLIGVNGSSVLLLGVVPQGAESLLSKLMQSLVANIKFGKSVVGTGKPANQKAWAQQLAGKRLQSSSASSSGSSNGFASSGSSTTLSLCRDQSYQYETQSFASVSVEGLDASSLGDNNGEQSSGRWSVEYATNSSVVIVLTETGGLQRRMVLNSNGSSWNANGRAVSIDQSGC